MNRVPEIKAAATWSGKHLFFWGALLLALLTALIFGLVTAQIWRQSDYMWHVTWASDMAHTGYINLPHTAYQQITLVFRAFIPFTMLQVFGSPFTDIFPTYSFQIAGFLTAIWFYVLLSLLIFHQVKKENPSISSRILFFLCLVVPLVLELISPINIFTLLNKNLYLGYIGITVFHNPTIVLLKPISLLLFWLVLNNFMPPDEEMGWKKWKSMLGIALLTIANLFTKPNFLLCFLPPLWIVAIIKTIKKEKVNWWMLLVALTAPCILILVGQYLFTFSLDQSEGIIFAPLQSVWYYTPSYFGIAYRFLLSCLFPVFVLCFYYKDVIREKRLVIAYLAFLVGLLFNYLVAETGPRAMHGNFEWGAQVTLFILFVEIVLFLIRHYSKKKFTLRKEWRLWSATGLLALHFLSGVIWYFAEVLRPHRWWGM